MKNTLTLLLVFFFVTPKIQAQTVSDFTVTTIHGETFNLYDKLDEGKYVFIDFFFTTCQPCIDIIPDMNTLYEEYGCNKGDEIFFISIDAGDSDADVLQFEEDYGGKLPTVSGIEGGGDAVVQAFNLNAFPHLVLISPEKEIVADIFPPTFDNIKATFNSFNITINPEACETVSSSTDLFTDELQVFPNPASDNLTVTWIGTETQSVKIIDIFGKVINERKVRGTDGKTELSINSLQLGTYVLTTNTDKGVSGRIIFQKL